MPEMDGFEASREIRLREGPTRHTRISFHSCLSVLDDVGGIPQRSELTQRNRRIHGDVLSQQYSQPALSSQTRAPRLAAHLIGIVKKAVEPMPTVLSSQTRPPCPSTMLRTIASPSPVLSFTGRAADAGLAEGL